jgi:hypothetical protein
MKKSWKKKRKRRDNLASGVALHPFPPRRHLTWWRLLPLLTLLLSLVIGLAQPFAAGADEPKGKKQKVADQFLIFGTVFEESGFLVREAEIQVRRAGEKRVRWRQYSDRRGEFAVRVPPGSEYELTVKAKGFETHTHKVDARTGKGEDLVIRLRSAAADGRKKQ